MLSSLRSTGKEIRHDISVLEFKKILRARKGFLWVDIEDPTKDDIAVLSVFDFHPLAIEDAVRYVELPKIDIYENHIFAVFHQLHHDNNRIITEELDFFLGKNYIVTVHKKKNTIIEDVKEKLKTNPLMMQGPDFVMHAIMDSVIDNYFPVLDRWDDELAKIEENISKGKTEGLMQQLIALKRGFSLMKKSLNPQRDMINKLAGGQIEFISHRTKIYFKDIYDHIFRIYSTLESYNDLSTVVFDAYLSSSSIKLNESSNKLNQTMQKLTLISTIFLPLTFIASVYGMNFKNMPELGWKYSYLSVWLIMIIIAVGMYMFFRKKHLL